MGEPGGMPSMGVAQNQTRLKQLSCSSSKDSKNKDSGKNTGVGCYFSLQGIFPTQGLKSHLLHWQADGLPLGHLGIQKMILQTVFLRKLTLGFFHIA